MVGSAYLFLILRTLVPVVSIAMLNTGTLVLQYYPIMRANGPCALIKSSQLHQCNHVGMRILRHIPLTPQKLGDTNQSFWLCKTDRILISCHSNSVLGLVENITSLV